MNVHLVKLAEEGKKFDVIRQLQAWSFTHGKTTVQTMMVVNENADRCQQLSIIGELDLPNNNGFGWIVRRTEPFKKK